MRSKKHPKRKPRATTAEGAALLSALNYILRYGDEDVRAALLSEVKQSAAFLSAENNQVPVPQTR